MSWQSKRNAQLKCLLSCLSAWQPTFLQSGCHDVMNTHLYLNIQKDSGVTYTHIKHSATSRHSMYFIYISIFNMHLHTCLINIYAACVLILFVGIICLSFYFCRKTFREVSQANTAHHEIFNLLPNLGWVFHLLQRTMQCVPSIYICWGLGIN
jgi:hypothetical protein